MISAQLPVIVMVLMLSAGLVVPLAAGRMPAKGLGTMSVSVLALGTISSFVSLAHVLNAGAYVYRFGGWPASIGVEFSIGPLTALMAVLVTLLSLAVVLYVAKDAIDAVRPRAVPGYYTIIFVAVFAMLGMVYTNDLFNMYVFMEILAIASCALVTIRGSRENLYAGLKYLLIGTVGSVTVLFGIAVLYMVSGNLNMTIIADGMPQLWNDYPTNVKMAIGFMLTGFGIKAAVFPLHTWLPDAHSTAPTGSSALLSGLVVTVYLFGAAKVLFSVIGAEVLALTNIPLMLSYVGMLGMIAGSVFALGQREVKRILAYSTVAHVGYMVLGMGLASEAGVSTAVFHMIAHGLMKTALFLSVGTVIRRTGKKYVSEFAGVGYRMPLTMLVFSIAALGMIGVPGVNGFMSKWYLILAGIDAGISLVVPVILLSSFLNALYYLPVISRAFMQRSTESDHVMKRDRLPTALVSPMVGIAILCIVTGLFPQLVMNIINEAVAGWL
ncbi:MAG: complex I subunit 5 family protein [Spirochaetota bacterium]